MPQGTAPVHDLENSNDGYYQKLDGKDESESPNFVISEKAASRMPWCVMPVLATAIILGSVAGPIMKGMERDGAAPLAVGAWRHEISATMMFPFAIWQWFRMKPQERSVALTWSNVGTICLCALGLTWHFSLWIWSLDNTALTHSLFLGIMSPIFVTLFTFLRDRTLVCTELLAVALGIVGSTILAAGAKVEKDIEYNMVGDLAALASACGFAVYLMCGRNLREKLPLFVYLWPVNVMVLIYFAIALFFLGEMSPSTKYHDAGLLSWMTQGYIGRTLILGMGPGFLSHIGYNTSLGYVKPLIVSVGFSVTPFVGSFTGWAMGETGIPGLLTLLGGLVTMGATVWLSHDSSRREAKTKEKSTVSEHIERKGPFESLIRNDDP